ncbi:MAG: 30S ribosomal protein S12 methylthiotransferase RimO [Planctomycetota bacterium]|nr:MAG: 30S ribosomal protein S12 methylthiotransferase RimO [Planctomycetota bacterium]
MSAPPSRSVCLVSLGCSKNLVDSEVMAGHLGRSGIQLVTEPEDADVVVVNTCGFIHEARQESVDTILQYVELKRRGELAGVVVTGCLVQLHQAELAEEIPEVDAFLGLSDYSGVPSIVDAVLGHGPGAICPAGEGSGGPALAVGPGAAAGLSGGGDKGGDADLGRALLTPPHTAYLRLGEGCDHICAFCAIPHIRGKLRSKPLEVLVEEASAMAQLGTVELTLVAEDSTDYGKDLKLGYGLAELLRALGEVEGIRWVRVMYAHPATIDQGLMTALAEVPNVVPYLDMPVQHGDAAVLKAMRRGTSPERIREVVAMARAAVPQITLRTTILTGFPGETEAGFEQLQTLLAELAFDRVGCFTFSSEQGTEAAGLPGAVPADVARARQAAVMKAQRARLEAANKARVGQIELLLLDAVIPHPEGRGLLAIGRSERDAPEVDGQVLVTLPAEGLPGWQPGAFVRAKTTGIQGYDLVALPAP